jgi:predicted RNA-binding protein
MGFTEAKKGRLKSFQVGDLITFYVPRDSLASSRKIRKFIGVAEVKGVGYESDTPIWKNGLFPQRIQMEPLSEGSCDIGPLIERLTFIKNKKSWGGTFLSGILRVPLQDFKIIQESMK